jgi:hypothetical protein
VVDLDDGVIDHCGGATDGVEARYHKWYQLVVSHGGKSGFEISLGDVKPIGMHHISC